MIFIFVIFLLPNMTFICFIGINISDDIFVCQ